MVNVRYSADMKRARHCIDNHKTRGQLKAAIKLTRGPERHTDVSRDMAVLHWLVPRSE